MTVQEKIEGWMTGREEELVAALAALVAVDSTLGTPAPGCPFGEGPKKALDAALAQAAQWGLTVSQDEGYVGMADLNSLPDRLHVLAHLDVVGVGKGWRTDPFTLVRRGDLVYGRGVQDDKGPAVAAMLAMRCVRELGLPLSGNVRLILGTDEETDSRDIAHYYAHHPFAPHALTPDACFPVINIEKARYAPTFGTTWPAQPSAPGHVSRIQGGTCINVVPGSCTAQIMGLSREQVEEQLQRVQAETAVDFKVTKWKNGVTVTASGMSTHAAWPDVGRNAISAMLRLLCALPLAEDAASKAIRTLYRLFPYGDSWGRSLGIAKSDSVSGVLTLAFSILELDETGFRASFDVRAPLCATEENTRRPVERAMQEAGWYCTGEMGPAHAVDENSDFVRTLLRSYERYTGRKGECIAIGGGTYVHDIPGGVAFGPGNTWFDNHCHGANERAQISQLMCCATIYADVIAQLCG